MPIEMDGIKGGSPSSIAPVAIISGPSVSPRFNSSRSFRMYSFGMPISRTSKTPLAIIKRPKTGCIEVVDMRIDQAGHQVEPVTINCLGTFRDFNIPCIADLFDPDYLQ